MKRVLVLAVMCIVVLCSAASAAQLSYSDLVDRLTNLESLAILPQPGETCAQASSYDRASYYDAKTGKYVAWDANGDGGGIVRTEGDKIIMAELEGPGCITRIWSAAPGDGHVRIYIDGAAEPVVDLPFKQYFDLKHEPFVYPALVHVVSQGWNAYVPIPFQKSCKVVADKNWGNYYHFTYTKFPKDTVVPTFKTNLSIRDKAALERANKICTDGLGSDPAGSHNGVTLGATRQIAPGKAEEMGRFTGEGAITAIRIKADPAKYTEDELRNVVLRIYWDGEKTPSVEAPIGDFFGSGLGAYKYKSLPLGSADTGLYSYWYMPYAKGAVIEITNFGKTSFTAPFEVVAYTKLARPASNYGRFHAKWHRDIFLPKESERWIDWPMMKVQGRGRFCGVALEVWNPKGGWWGEGDEKFFVDGEKLPSTIGTGSEDYFGYAWCNPTPFYNALHNQPRNDGNNVGHVVVNRWHITDNVPFQTSFEADIEKYYKNNRPTHYACVAYWYQASGDTDPYPAIAEKNLMNWYDLPVLVKKPGVYEGEDMKIISKTGGNTDIQSLGDRFSNESHLWWTGAKPGDKLTLSMPIEKAGKYEIKMQFTKAIDYGIIQIILDGKKLGEPVDFYNDGVIPTGPVPFGTLDLTAGDHQLTAEIIGANEKAIKSYMFGLDAVLYKAAK